MVDPCISIEKRESADLIQQRASYRTCRTFPPSAIPVDGLTHVNFAFAYIDPATYKVTTMDSKTPEDLFTQTADIRSLKSNSANLEVFISIGGWTFSDNGTATQSVFPDIASDAGKRQTFANNLVSFMKQYGFDGVLTLSPLNRQLQMLRMYRSISIGSTRELQTAAVKRKTRQITFFCWRR